MCWQIALPLLTTAAGAGMQAKAAHDLSSDQQRIAAEGILRQSQLNRDASTRVAQTTQQIASSDASAETAAKRETYLDALRKTLPARQGANPVNGAVSSRFAQDTADAQGESEAEAVQNAGLAAEIDAPALQRQREGVAVDNTGVDLNTLRSKAQGQDYLNKLRLALAKPNQGLMIGGQLLSGAGGAMAAGGGYGADAGQDAFGMPTVAAAAKKYGKFRGSMQPGAGFEGVPA